MESFEKILNQYEPLIKKTIKRFHYVDVYDELFQIGSIALWEAYERYDSDKGHFPSYARSYITGRILQRLNQSSFVTTEASDQLLDTISGYEVPFLESMIVEEYMKNLSGRERLYVKFVLIHQGSQKELAEREGVSYETVRSWRKTTLAKLRIKGHAMNNI